MAYGCCDAQFVVIFKLMRAIHAKLGFELIDCQRSVRHIYVIPPDGLWVMQADIGL